MIGNETYKSLAPLGNPRLDAGRLAALLDANGFDVVRCDGQHPGCFDLDRDGLEDALQTFRKKADGADLALAFFAGHGMEGRDGNVIAPVDMEVSDCAERALPVGKRAPITINQGRYRVAVRSSYVPTEVTGRHIETSGCWLKNLT